MRLQPPPAGLPLLQAPSRARPHQRQPIHVRHLLGVLPLVPEYPQHLRVQTQEQPDGLGAALLVRGAQRAEPGVVGVAGLVVRRRGLARERVQQRRGEVQGAVGFLAEEFAGTVAEQLVEADLRKGRLGFRLGLVGV